jgi:hypothetical protein
MGVALALLTWGVLSFLKLLDGSGPKLFSLAVIGVPVRFLVAIPLFFVCETWVVPQMAEFTRYMVRSGLVAEASLPALASDIHRVGRMNNFWLAELLLLLLYSSIAMVMLLAAVLFIGPLFIFARKLYICRWTGMSEYMAMASRYVKAFDRKWIRNEQATGASQLGTSDLQSLADLTTSLNVVRRDALDSFRPEANPRTRFIGDRASVAVISFEVSGESGGGAAISHLVSFLGFPSVVVEHSKPAARRMSSCVWETARVIWVFRTPE